MKEEISYDDFAKLDIRIGTVIAAELVPETDKLIKCRIDFGDPPAGGGTRTIVSGIAQWKKPEELIGRQFPYIMNLAPRILRGVESQGMPKVLNEVNVPKVVVDYCSRRVMSRELHSLIPNDWYPMAQSCGNRCYTP